MSLVLLAGYMNTYTSNPAPIDPTGGFAGNTVTPFEITPEILRKLVEGLR